MTGAYYNYVILPKHLKSYRFHVEHCWLPAQNYLSFADVPRGTLNNDVKATKAQMASKTIKG